METVKVPEQFKVKNTVKFPLHQGNLCLDERAAIWFNGKNVNTERVYVPVPWYSYQISAKYAKDLKMMNALKEWVSRLPANKKYWTVTQYADGVMGYGKFFPFNNWRIFGAGGCGTDAIPLTVDKHPYSGEKKKILCSFVGSFNTHPIRYLMNSVLGGEKGFHIEETNTREANYAPAYKKFLGITSKSYFVLCPRGYGRTSFRLYESMQLGCVPVYISDDPWIPFEKYLNWRRFAVVVHPCEIKEIPGILNSIVKSGEYENMRKEAIETYEKYFTYSGCFKTIRRMLEEE